MTIETKIKFQDIVENQVPRFVRDDFPLLPDFLKSYYVSQEVPGGTLDLMTAVYGNKHSRKELKIMTDDKEIIFREIKCNKNTGCR